MGELLFFSIILIIIYTYFGYPLVLVIISIFSNKKLKFKKEYCTPTVSIFIPVYNEEKVIGKKIENILKINYDQKLLQIVIASDGSTDNTEKIVKEFKKNNIVFVKNKENQGKNKLINRYINILSGEIIIFTDANSLFNKDSICLLTRHFSDEKVGFVGGKLKYSDGKSSTAKGEGLYFKYENFIKKLEGQNGKLIGANGSIYAIRKELLVPVPSHVPNDFYHPLTVLARNFYSTFEEQAIAIEKPTETSNEEFKRRRRIVNRSVGAISERINEYGFLQGKGWFYIISHKILRWLISPMLLVLYAVNISLLSENSFYLFVFLLQNSCYMLGIIGYFMKAKKHGRVTIIFIPFYFLLINVACFWGIINYLTGKKVEKWAIADSTR